MFNKLHQLLICGIIYLLLHLQVTAQVLRKRNSIVCQTTADVLNVGNFANPSGIYVFILLFFLTCCIIIIFNAIEKIILNVIFCLILVIKFN